MGHSWSRNANFKAAHIVLSLTSSHALALIIFHCKSIRKHFLVIRNSWGSCVQSSCKHRKTSFYSIRQGQRKFRVWGSAAPNTFLHYFLCVVTLCELSIFWFTYWPTERQAHCLISNLGLIQAEFATDVCVQVRMWTEVFISHRTTVPRCSGS